MERCFRVNITPEVVHALSAMPQVYGTAMRIYNKNKPKFFAAAQASPFKNNYAIKLGRAEHQVMSMRILGILSSGTDIEINTIFRAVDKKCYDRMLEDANRGETIVLENYLKDSKDSDSIYNKFIAFLGWCESRKFPVEKTEFVKTLFARVIYMRESIAMYKDTIQEAHPEEVSCVTQTQLGIDDCVGVDGLYNTSNDHVREILEPFCSLFNMEDLDAGTYTDGIHLTYKDMIRIATPTREETIMNAFLLLIIRAIKKDKEFCLNMYRDDKTVNVENAYIERDKAKQEVEALRSRIRTLEESLRLERKNYESAKREIESRRGDISEIISLRSALYASATQEDPKEEKQPPRDIPVGTIGIGGHPSWARELSKETGIKIWPRGTTCPQAVLSSAPEVWIQPAYMDHSSFYAAIKAARKANVTVRYFSSTGVTRCVAEMRAK